MRQYKADAFVSVVLFFDSYYLMPDESTGFDPSFYEDKPLPTPEYHLDILMGWATYKSTLDVAPRGGAKSALARKAIIVCLVSRGMYKIIYCTSSAKNAVETAQIVRDQCYNNPRIQEDFGPEYDGRLKPPRGDAPTGLSWFQLNNGSQLVTYSVNSKMRGGRPHWFILDDPEYDPHASTSMAERRAYMSRLIFKIAMPMIMKANTRMSWIATFVSKRHYAWRAFETQTQMVNGQSVQVSKIAEFSFWHRRVIKACWAGPDGKLTSCWPHMWPVDDAQKEELGLDDTTETLESLKKRIGQANFQSEYLANPGESDAPYFDLDDKLHGWWVDQSTVDEHFATAPFKSQTLVTWRNGEEEESARLCDLVSRLRMFIAMDTSKTATPESDWKVATLMGVDKSHNLFVLDCWAGKVHQEKFADAAFAMAARWNCRLISPELIDDGITLARMMRHTVARLTDEGKIASAPVIQGFNPGQVRKSAKIAALMPRFQHGKIKFPFWQRGRSPWIEMFDQFEGFNPDAGDDCGLANDDHADTVAMSEFIIGLKAVMLDEILASKVTTVMEIVERGGTTTHNGHPLSAYVDISAMEGGDLMRLGAFMNRTKKDENLI